MLKHQLFILMLLAMIGASSLRAQSSEMECILEIQIPSYNATARRSTTGGDVRARIMIGRQGEPVSIDLGDSEPDLAAAVRPFLVNKTKYSQQCAGRTIQLIFTFELEGAPEVKPPEWVRFLPPNHFFIVSRPRIYELIGSNQKEDLGSENNVDGK